MRNTRKHLAIWFYFSFYFYTTIVISSRRAQVCVCKNGNCTHMFKYRVRLRANRSIYYYVVYVITKKIGSISFDSLRYSTKQSLLVLFTIEWEWNSLSDLTTDWRAHKCQCNETIPIDWDTNNNLRKSPLFLHATISYYLTVTFFFVVSLNSSIQTLIENTAQFILEIILFMGKNGKKKSG